MDNLKTKLSKIKVIRKDKTSLVQNLFTDISAKYDLMNDLMSFGTHRLWKKRFIEMIDFQNNDKIVDIGSGTGDLIELIFKKNKNVNIYSVDLNKKMQNECKKKFINYKENQINFINANAEKLIFESNFFDKYLISFCLRNISFIEKALNEAFRVLKPGGIFYCLEFSTPNSSFLDLIYSKYKNKIIPLIGDKITGNRNAYKYLEESINQFPSQDVLLNIIKNIGFEKTSYINLFDGIVCIHKGFKI